MAEYCVIKDILNVRTSADANINDNYAGDLLKGATIDLTGDMVTGTKPYGGNSDQWFKYNTDYFIAADGVAPKGSYAAKKAEFLADKSMAAYHKNSENEDDWSVSWAHVDLEIWKLWEQEIRGQGVKAVVLDSGLNYNLEAFKDKNIEYYNCENRSNKREDCFESSSENHGTKCAGLLCGNGSKYFGIAPDTILYVIKITRADGTTDNNLVLEGLKKAIEIGADIISLSYSIADEGSSEIHDRIIDAYNKNIIVLSAVGDGGEFDYQVDPTGSKPASFSECLSIGGINKQRKRSEISSLSDTLDLMTPCEELPSASGPYHIETATSFAAPVAAGAVALLLSALKSKGIAGVTSDSIFRALKNNADKSGITDYNIIKYGSGVINIQNSITSFS